MTQPPKRRGREPGTGFAKEPIFKKKVLKIIRLRDKGLQWEEVAQQISPPMTAMGALLTYRRWKVWADKVNKESQK